MSTKSSSPGRQLSLYRKQKLYYDLLLSINDKYECYDILLYNIDRLRNMSQESELLLLMQNLDIRLARIIAKEVSKGINHWHGMIIEIKQIMMERKAKKQGIIDIYRNYVFSDTIWENQEIIYSKYDAVRTVMFAAFRIGWYAIYHIELKKKPSFLSGQIWMVSGSQSDKKRVDIDIEIGKNYTRIYMMDTAADNGISDLSLIL